MGRQRIAWFEAFDSWGYNSLAGDFWRYSRRLIAESPFRSVPFEARLTAENGKRF
jgi:hypothetical protein